MRILVGIPTLNEFGNIQKLLTSIESELHIEVGILVVDDGSTDGCAEYLVKNADLGKIHLIQRAQQLGIGSAHKCIIDFAYRNGFSVIATLDADGTHSVKDLQKVILKLIDSPEEMVIGSRFIDGGQLRNWPIHRRIATEIAHVLTRLATREPFDCTTGLRAYRTSSSIVDAVMKTKYEDYRFFYKSIFDFIQIGIRINQVPVTLEARYLGNSKMNLKRTYSLVKSLIMDSCIYALYSRFLSHK